MHVLWAVTAVAMVLTWPMATVTMEADSYQTECDLLQEYSGINTDDSGLSYTSNPASYMPVCPNQYTKLSCCVQNYQLLIWKKLNTATHTWEYVTSTDLVGFSDATNQTLVLERPSFGDAGLYRCVATDGLGATLSHDVELVVHECGAWNSKPLISSPIEGVYYRLPGSTFHVVCDAFYGTNYQNDQLWGNSGPLWYLEVAGGSGRIWLQGNYSISDRISYNYSRLEHNQVSVIEIRNITAEDVGNYTCVAINSMGSDQRTVILALGDPNAIPSLERPVPDTTSLVLAWGLGITILMVTALALVLWVFRVDVQLKVKDTVGKPRNPDALWDAFFVHNDMSEDAYFVVNTLLPTLEDQHRYRLAVTQRDFQAGGYESDAWLRLLDSSQSVVFLISEHTRQQEWCDLAFQHVVAREYTNLVFIVYGDIAPSSWEDHQDPLVQVMQRSKNVLYWPSSTRDQASFWKRLRLALPPRLALNQEETRFRAGLEPFYYDNMMA